MPAYGEGETEEETIADLMEALRGYVETFGLGDTLPRLNSEVSARKVDLDFFELARS